MIDCVFVQTLTENVGNILHICKLYVLFTFLEILEYLIIHQYVDFIYLRSAYAEMRRSHDRRKTANWQK